MPTDPIASRGASPSAQKIYRRARELPRKTYTRPDGLLNKTVSFAPADLVPGKSGPVSLDTVWTTMTAAKEAGHEGQGAEADHDSWQ